MKRLSINQEEIIRIAEVTRELEHSSALMALEIIKNRAGRRDDLFGFLTLAIIMASIFASMVLFQKHQIEKLEERIAKREKFYLMTIPTQPTYPKG